MGRKLLLERDGLALIAHRGRDKERRFSIQDVRAKVADKPSTLARGDMAHWLDLARFWMDEWDTPPPKTAGGTTRSGSTAPLKQEDA